MKYMDYMAEVGSRVEKGKKGKAFDNVGLFPGVQFDSQGNIIKL